MILNNNKDTFYMLDKIYKELDKMNKLKTLELELKYCFGDSSIRVNEVYERLHAIMDKQDTD